MTSQRPTPPSHSGTPRLTLRGIALVALVFFAAVGVGTYPWWSRMLEEKPTATKPAAPAKPATPAAPTPEFIAPLTSCPLLPAAGTHVPKDNTLDLELSEYAGYAGLIVANGGLAPTENSYFFRQHGFKVRLRLSEEESWPALNRGDLAATATTVDVLAAYCRNFQVVAPVQIGFSRGADGLVVRKEIRRVNDLRGRTLVTAQFTEADFFIRYLAQEAGLGVKMLRGPGDAPAPDQVNVVFARDAFAAGDLFLKDLQDGGNWLAGCVTWAPKTSEVVDAAQGAAVLLTTNRNLLIIADVLIVNRGFAQAQPRMVAGLVAGVLEGNRLVRDQPAAQLETIGRAFKWTPDKVRAELAKVHLANLPENLAFYSGAIDVAGSFAGIHAAATLAYGALIDQPVDADRYMEPVHLQALAAAGAFAGQRVAIAPLRGPGGENPGRDPLLTKDVRFLFEPNSATLDLNHRANLAALDAIKGLLQVSPGSTILLRGHVDNAMVETFRKQGGEGFIRQMALKAMALSKGRATEIRRVLIERLGVPAARLETVGRGWEEPAGADAEQNRRVEVQWFTLE